MNSINYSSKGIYVKRLLNNHVVPQTNCNKEIKQLMKLRYFKNLQLFEDILLDEKNRKKFIKEYILESKKKNNFDKIIEADKHDPIRFISNNPSSFRNKIMSHYNPHKK